VAKVRYLQISLVFVLACPSYRYT